MLESLAYSNFASPRPRPIDPAVFFDLVKIRRLVEDATDLSVRATNGTTLSSLNNSLNGSNGIFGGGGPATLGLGLGRNGNAKLSRERRHRMRELATQKLSRAYQLDEIAASVATMQSTSSLEEVAKLVLQRSPTDPDAKYVHFFHEKIPSRRLAESTDLGSLDEIIHDRPTEAGPLRTRGVTRIFKEDFIDAARDLTDGLLICRYMMSQHKSDTPELRLVSTNGETEIKSGVVHRPTYEVKVEDKDPPNGLEAQFLFQRAGVYLALACQNIHPSLDDSMSQNNFDSITVGGQEKNTDPVKLESSINSISDEAHQRQLEARKLVKAYAKRALRDYINYLSNFEYTPGLSPEVAVDFLRKVNSAAGGVPKSKGTPTNRLLEMSGNSGLSGGNLSDALIPHSRSDPMHQAGRPFREGVSYPRLPLPPADVYPISVLFSSSPPPNLPPFPSSALLQTNLLARDQFPEQLSASTWAQIEPFEAVTYHPLLTDALHSVLLCHSLLQTSSKEHLRHAHMAARLARVCDGYPIFVACRSPSRADWIEVIRQANNWLGLEKSWETLCTPAPLPGHASAPTKEETEAEIKERRMQESILEALADEGVVDDATFRAAVAARERRAEEQNSDNLTQGGSSPKRWAQDDGKGYPRSTGRAEEIAKWVREAPQVLEGLGKGKGGKKGKGRKQSP